MCVIKIFQHDRMGNTSILEADEHDLERIEPGQHPPPTLTEQSLTDQTVFRMLKT